MQDLQEITNIQQDAPGKTKRWFTSAEDDLYTWVSKDDEEGELIAFEFCYNKLDDEHALHWHRGQAASHMRIDDGDNPGGHKRSPLAVTDGVADMDGIIERYRQVASHIEPVLYAAVLQAMQGITLQTGQQGNPD